MASDPAWTKQNRRACAYATSPKSVQFSVVKSVQFSIAIDSSSAFLAIFSDEANGASLGSYQRLDASLTTPVRISERTNALALLAVSNALGRRNPRAKAYSLDFETTYDIHYPPRVFVAGLIFLF